QVRRFGLRKGDDVRGATRRPARSEKYPALVRVDVINGMTPDEARGRTRFEDLTPLFPDSRLRLELDAEPGEITGRIIDLISPIGKGQRGMIVSPPKAGKTTIIKQLVYSIERNNPECHVIVLLVDEGALYPPKKFVGAARNVEEGGSLTILATALVDTNSKMDEHIFEEFKGTGNMELRLDRRMADRRIYPAIDVEQSSTRHEELL